MGKLKIFFVCFYVMTSASIVYAAVDRSLPALVICKNRSQARTIRVNKTEDGVCETFYSKHGVDQLMSTARTELGCFRVIDNIKTNLEQASWNCRQVSQFIVDTPKTDNSTKE